MSYFDVFSLPPKLHIDTAALEKQFYAQSRRLHPDRFASRPAAEQDEALRQSSQLNDAYRTLKDAILRTQYLLKLEGVDLEEQSKAATDAARAAGGEKKQVVPPELLEEVFELNMQLQEMKMAKQMGEDEFTVLFHQGARDSIQLQLVGERTLLAIVFDQRTNLGLVRFYAKEAVKRLEAAFKEIASRPQDQQPQLSDKFSSDAAAALDRIF